MNIFPKMFRFLDRELQKKIVFIIFSEMTKLFKKQLKKSGTPLYEM